MLQGRFFSYTDTQLHRLGTNFEELPINCRYSYGNYNRPNAACYIQPQNTPPNYFPNSFGGLKYNNKLYYLNNFEQTCDAGNYSTIEDNYSQVGLFWKNVLNDDERDRLAKNIANHLSGAKEFIQKRALDNFEKCHPDYAGRIIHFMNK